MAMRRQEQQQNSRRPISCPSFCGRYNFKRIRPRAQSLLPRAVVDYFSVKDREMYFLFVLGIAYVVEDYVFMVLITILTDEWQLKLDQAVTITNIQEASKSTLMVLCAYLTDCKLGNSKMLGIAALIYGLGVLVLGLTYPHFTPEEIFQCQTTDFCPKKPMPITLYLGLVLITFGQCGSFLYGYRGRQEVEEVEEENHGTQNWLIVVLKLRAVPYNGCRGNEFLKKIWEILRKKIDWIYVIGMILAIFLFPQMENIYFTLTFMLWGGCAWFALGKAFFYECDKPSGSPLSVFGGVISVACRKGSVDSQTCVVYTGDEDDDPNGQNSENDNNTQNHSNSNRLSEDDGVTGYESSPNEVNHRYEHRDVNDADIELNKVSSATPEAHNPSNTVEMKDSQNVDDYKKYYPRCLNKAAYYDPLTHNCEDLRRKGKLYSIQQVEDTKKFIRAYILSSLFLFYGIMTAVGSTFFVEQANIMDRHIGVINVPIELFVLSSTWIQKIVSQICKWVIPKEDNTSPHGFYGALRVLCGMLCSLPCFFIASAVEVKRRRAFNEDNVEITAYWLLPQIFFMGSMDGLALNGMEVFFDKEMPKGFKRLYGEFFAEGSTGLGKFLSVGFFHVVRKLTKTSNKTGWFGDDINASHLDYYYKVMACVGAISSTIYVVVVVVCYYFKARALE